MPGPVISKAAGCGEKAFVVTVNCWKMWLFFSPEAYKATAPHSQALFLFSRQFFFISLRDALFVKNNVPEPWQMDKTFITLLKHLFILYCDGKKTRKPSQTGWQGSNEVQSLWKIFLKNLMFKFNRISCCKICLNNLGLPFRTQGWILRGKPNPP